MRGFFLSEKEVENEHILNHICVQQYVRAFHARILFIAKQHVFAIRTSKEKLLKRIEKPIRTSIKSCSV